MTTQAPQLIMTTTGELFLPSRVVYRVYDHVKVLAKFRQLSCMAFDAANARWTWNYEGEAKRMGFPADYDQLPPERQPVVLASCHWVKSDLLQVYVRSTLRLRKFLVFFDQQVPRNWAKGEFLDEYNLVSKADLSLPLPTPEDFFRDESKLQFWDNAAEISGGSAAAEFLRKEQERTLAPLERHRLEAFYEDGEEYLVGAMRFREFLAMKQDQSAAPIRPFQVVNEMMRASRALPASSPGSGPGDLEVTSSKPGPEAQRERDASHNESSDFSFLRRDPAQDSSVLELVSEDGQTERYVAKFWGCDNPACDCRALTMSLELLAPSGPPRQITQLDLDFHAREIRCKAVDNPNGRRLARELARRFREGDWRLARSIYESEKADHSEPKDASGLDLPFPEDGLADPSLLIDYQEVFRYASRVRFEQAGQLWIVLERYCTNPDCPCTEVYLDLAPMPTKVADLTSASPLQVVKDKEVVGLQFDYVNGAATVRKAGAPGSPPPFGLLGALKAANPDFGLRCQRRQKVLRQLHERARQLRSGLKGPQPTRAPKKTGRNDPCPCGSGKKFKHCCGR